MRFICILSCLLLSSQILFAQDISTEPDSRTFYEKFGSDFFSVTPLWGTSTPDWGHQLELDIGLAGPVLSFHLWEQKMNNSFSGPDYESDSHGTSDRWMLDETRWAWGIGLGYELFTGYPWVANFSFAPAIEYFQTFNPATFETRYDASTTDDIVVDTRRDIRLMARLQAELFGFDLRLGLGMGYNLTGWYEKYTDERIYLCVNIMVGYRVHWGPKSIE